MIIITLLTIVSTVSFILHLGTRKQPLHPDSGFFLYIPFFKSIGYTYPPARVVSLSPPNITGGYHILDSKFLLRFFVHFVIILGGSIKSFRIFFSFYHLLTGFALYALASIIGSPFLGLLTASIYWLMSLSPYLDSFNLHAEQYAFLPIILAVIAILLSGGREVSQMPLLDYRLLLFAGGLLLGVVIMCLKISYVIEIFAILCLSVFWGFSVWAPFLIICGMLSFILWIILYTYIKTRSIDLFLLSYSPFTHLYYRGTIPADRNIFKYDFKAYFAIFSCFFYGMCYFVTGIVCAVINHNTIIITIAILPLASLINILYQNKFYMAHFFSLLPLSSVAAAYGVEQVLGLSGFSFILVMSFSILILIPAFMQIFQYYIKFDALTFHLKMSHLIRQRKILNFIAEERIAEYIKNNTSKDDFVLQWGYHHEFYVLAERRAALSGNLAATLMTDPQLNDVSISNWRKCILSDIEHFAPKYIIDFDGSLNIGVVNDITGHYYELDKHFYNIYPIYKLASTHFSEKMKLSEKNLKSLTENNTEREINSKIFKNNADCIQFINSLALVDDLKKADVYTEGGISKMFNDWCRINKEKSDYRIA